MSINKFNKFIATVILSFVSCFTHALVIDFEGVSSSSINSVGSFFDVGDFRFTMSANISSGFANVTSQTGLIENGTTKLFVANHSEVTLSRADGLAFDLNSLDIAGSWVSSPNRWADTVDLIAGGNTFTATLTGMPSSYQNIAPAFNNVTSVLFRPFGRANAGVNDFEFNIDNLVLNDVAAVSEPSLAALFLMGLFSLSLVRRRTAKKA